MAADVAVYAPNYRLAPEHPHPTALDDGLEAYRWLLGQGVSPDRVALAGDSAGGGLALATAIAIRDSELPSPASLVLISPWVDLCCDSPSMTTNMRIGLWHEFQIHAGMLEAAHEAVARIATFLDAHWPSR